MSILCSFVGRSKQCVVQGFMYTVIKKRPLRRRQDGRNRGVAVRFSNFINVGAADGTTEAHSQSGGKRDRMPIPGIFTFDANVF